MLHPIRWTWDWSLPALRHLVLSGDLHEIRFSFGILRSCPTLRSIVLNHEDRSHRFPLCVKEIFDDSLDENNNNQVLPFTHSNLLSIEFNGEWIIQTDELAWLLQMLPCLMEIQFGTSKFDEGFGDRELVEITKIHPALRYVISALELTDRTKSSFALNHVNSEQLEEIVSLVGDIEGYLAQETPKERLMTVYGFKNCVATLHQL
ncbi:hypothetical protein BGW42_003919 [Actinomortierella wolfii]|nr:hypothetical protein BGW42_003919 [Actinomortierella wolfii]